MESRLLSTPKLKGALSHLMAEAFELGYIPAINNTQSKNLCLIVSNSDSGKLALLGTMVNEQGKREVAACMVNAAGWLWAETEGFTRDDIVYNSKLYAKIFEPVSVASLPYKLA